MNKTFTVPWVPWCSDRWAGWPGPARAPGSPRSLSWSSPSSRWSWPCRTGWGSGWPYGCSRSTGSTCNWKLWEQHHFLNLGTVNVYKVTMQRIFRCVNDSPVILWGNAEDLVLQLHRDQLVEVWRDLLRVLLQVGQPGGTGALTKINTLESRFYGSRFYEFTRFNGFFGATKQAF